jgi:WD40 repeat protein
VGHSDAIQSVAFSSSGTYIASSSADKTIMMWNAKSGDFVGSPFDGHTDIVQSVTFSPDNMQLVSGSNDCTVRVWDVEHNKNTTGLLLNHEVNNNTQKKHSATAYITPQGHTDYVNSVAFSPGGRYIVSGSGDKTVVVWNVETGKAVFGPLKEHADYVSSVIFSPDGRYIFSGSVDRTIKSWDLKSGWCVCNMGCESGVTAIAISPNGKHILYGLGDKTIWVYDMETSKAIIGPIKGHTSYITSVAFSPTGK